MASPFSGRFAQFLRPNPKTATGLLYPQRLNDPSHYTKALDYWIGASALRNNQRFADYVRSLGGDLFNQYGLYEQTTSNPENFVDFLGRLDFERLFRNAPRSVRGINQAAFAPFGRWLNV